MKLDNAGRSFIKGFEGFSTVPYLCSAGVPTLGFGSTMYPNGRKVTMRDKPVSLEEANVIFDWHVGLFEADVTKLTRTVTLHQNQFNSLTSFAYNLGSDIDADDIPEGLGDSTLLKKVLAHTYDPTIRTEFLKWNKAKGVPVKGLTNRRTAEAEMYFKK